MTEKPRPVAAFPGNEAWGNEVLSVGKIRCEKHFYYFFFKWFYPITKSKSKACRFSETDKLVKKKKKFQMCSKDFLNDNKELSTCQ